MDEVSNDARTVTPDGIAFSHQEIFAVVDDFYMRVQKDPLLSVPFASVHDWPEHIARLTHFWWIRFGGKPYMLAHYDPISKHFHAGFNEELLVRWLDLFHKTFERHLSADQCEFWKALSKRMGQSLFMRNEMIKKQNGATRS